MLPLMVFSGGIRDSIFELPQVEVRADRVMHIERAGMAVTIIEPLVLDQKRHMSLAALLSENTHAFVKSQGRGGLATVSLRGTGTSHTQLLWNGMPVTDPMTGMSDLSLFPVFIADEMVLLHGNASVARHSGGLGGSIHINTKPVFEPATSIKYTQGIGSYRSYEQYLLAGTGNHRLQYRLRAYHTQSANNYTFINRGLGYWSDDELIFPVDTMRHADYGRYGFLQEFYFRTAGNHLLSVNWWSQWADRGIPQAISRENIENPILSRQHDNDHRFVAGYSHFLTSGSLIFRTAYSKNKMIFSRKHNISGFGEVPFVYSESGQQAFYNHASHKHHFNENLSIEHSLDADYRQVESRDTVLMTGYEQDRMIFSYFFSLRKRFWSNLHLNLMLRQEWMDGNRLPLLPFLGAEYRLPIQAEVYLQANVAANYRYPSLNDMYWQPGGNPDLLPEEGFSYEFGIRYNAEMGANTLQTTLSFYRADISNWIMWIPGVLSYWKPVNVRRVLSDGAELGIMVNGSLGEVEYNVLGSYAYTRALNYGDPDVWGSNSYKKQLVYIPRHSGNAMIRLGARGWTFSWHYNAYSERFTTSTNDVSRREWLYPYYMNDVSLGRDFRAGKLQLSAELFVYNLFDETYHTVLYQPMPGRNFMVFLRIGV